MHTPSAARRHTQVLWRQLCQLRRDGGGGRASSAQGVGEAAGGHGEALRVRTRQQGERRRRSAKSKKKVLEKREESVAKPKLREPTLTFKFPECSRLAPPVMPFEDVSFSYSGKAADNLYKLDIGVDCDSRVALVGPNGCGKSTLLKLMSGERPPPKSVKRHQHCALKPCSTEVLDLDMALLPYRKVFRPRNSRRRMSGGEAILRSSASRPSSRRRRWACSQTGSARGLCLPRSR